MPGLRRKRKKKWVTAVTVILIVALLATGGVLFYRHQCEERKLAAFQKEYEAFYASKLEAFAAENALYEDYEVDVAFIGDSLTDGYDVKSAYPFYTVVNRGIAGDTTIRLEERLQVSLYDLKPKVVVMLIGANNFHTMLSNYERILKGFQENLPDTKIILVSLTCMGGEWGKNNQIAAYNNVRIEKLAIKYNYTFVDLYAPLMNPETGEIYDEYTTDGGHLTPLGYEVFTQTVTPAIDRFLRWRG